MLCNCKCFDKRYELPEGMYMPKTAITNINIILFDVILKCKMNRTIKKTIKLLIAIICMTINCQIKFSGCDSPTLMPLLQTILFYIIRMLFIFFLLIFGANGSHKR